MNHKIIILSTFLILFTANLTAQRGTVRICGEYTYYPPENVSLEQARQTALERAKLAAVAEQFGTTLTQVNGTVLKNENGKSDVWFRQIGSSEVKGEWLNDTGTPAYGVRYEQGMLTVHVSVCGVAREIKGAGVDFLAKVLRNGTKSSFESYDFMDGNDIFLWFRTPMEGYLAVYLIDDADKAFCLLPYMNSQTGKTPVKANREYVFFSRELADPSEKEMVTGYVLTCNEKPAEHNFLYIIFSPNEFTKANDMRADNLLPRELSFEDFQRWLARNKQRDKDMKVDIKGITIKK